MIDSIIGNTLILQIVKLSIYRIINLSSNLSLSAKNSKFLYFDVIYQIIYNILFVLCVMRKVKLWKI